MATKRCSIELKTRHGKTACHIQKKSSRFSENTWKDGQGRKAMKIKRTEAQQKELEKRMEALKKKVKAEMDKIKFK